MWSVLNRIGKLSVETPVKVGSFIEIRLVLPWFLVLKYTCVLCGVTSKAEWSNLKDKPYINGAFVGIVILAFPFTTSNVFVSAKVETLRLEVRSIPVAYCVGCGVQSKVKLRGYDGPNARHLLSMWNFIAHTRNEVLTLDMHLIACFGLIKAHCCYWFGFK